MLALLSEQIDGKYEILEKLREGGMGAIYKVRHRLLDEVRVVKVIRSQADTVGEAADRFLREARAAIKLRHPNIAQLHDFAVADDGQAFIVMEYIDGWNLLEVLSGFGPPPISLTLEIARQSLKALGYLHRHKIVHRDVSPDNLMLTRDVDGHPLVKLIDLGIAKALGGAGRAHHHRRLPRQAALRLAGAVRRRRLGRAERPLLLRRRALRAAHRPAAVRRQRSGLADGRPPLPAAARLRRERSRGAGPARSCGRSSSTPWPRSRTSGSPAPRRSPGS